MKKALLILLSLWLFTPLIAQTAEGDLSRGADAPDRISKQDSAYLAFRPDPARAVWMGAIIPGYGQIYNRSYWKLPIVYGGFMGCIYAISINNRYYQDYRHGYASIVLGTDDFYLDLIPEGYTLAQVGGISGFTRTLQNKRDSFRRFRDLSIVATVLVYALSLVDAYVDAQLWDFDISPDLSLQVSPSIYSDPLYNDPLNNRSLDLNFAIRF